MRRRLFGGASLAPLVVAAVVVACVSGGLGAGCGGGTGQVVGDAAAGADADASGGGGGDAGAGGDGDAPGGVDCTASCDRIAAICDGVSNIDENWLSICRQNCGVRLAVMPETAQAEVACTAAAPDCATAVLCSMSPTGGNR